MHIEEMVMTLLREHLSEALAREFDTLRSEFGAQARAGVRDQLEDLRGYSDAQLCRKLNFSRTTLWHIRDDPRGPRLLKSGYVYPGARTRLTTAQQLRDYLTLVEAHADALAQALDGWSIFDLSALMQSAVARPIFDFCLIRFLLLLAPAISQHFAESFCLDSCLISLTKT